jgi:hypothetical protein
MLKIKWTYRVRNSEVFQNAEEERLLLKIKKIGCFILYSGITKINPFQPNFSVTRILPSSYLFWAGKRLVGYL